MCPRCVWRLKEAEKTKNKKKQSEENIIKVINNTTIRDIKNLYEQEEDYYKPVRTGSFYGNNYIDYESERDINKTLLIKEYIDEIKPYLKHIKDNLKISETWKIQLTMATNFISFKDTDEKPIMHSKIDNI